MYLSQHVEELLLKGIILYNNNYNNELIKEELIKEELLLKDIIFILNSFLLKSLEQYLTGMASTLNW